jgi:hypothetical protein
MSSIDKQLSDPNIDPLDAIKLQNDKQNIQDNIDKFKKYGGFTKPKKAKVGGRSGKYGNNIYSTTNTSALRNLVKGTKITRKRIKR